MKKLPGLAAGIKDKLIQQALERKLRQASTPAGQTPARPAEKKPEIPEEHYRFHLHPGYQQLRIINDGAKRLGVKNPFFKLHEGTAGADTHINGREFVNYASYN
ncbi:MAG: 8-amino-7-oxononanoate synthase, partial [Achromobacter kerstersii]